MKIDPKQLLFLLLIVGMPLASWFWYFQPANAAYQADSEKLAAREEKLADLRAALIYLDDLDREVQSLAKAVSFFEDKLPGRHEVHRVLAQITQIANQYRMESRVFETAQATTFADCSELPIRIEVLADFESFYQFLLELERMPRITRVRQLALRDNAGDGLVEARLALSVFFEATGG